MDYTDLDESMGAFEGAVASSKAQIKTPTCGTILLALDGSNQDATAIALTGAIAPRMRANVRVTICSYDGEPDRGAAERAVKELKERSVDAETVFEDGKLPAERIVAAKRKLNAGLVIAPAPYIGDIGLLKDESLSSTIDLLLAELRCALLVVRQPLEDPVAHLKRIVLPMTMYHAAMAYAAGWAFCLAEGAATIELVAVADQHAARNAATLTGDEDPESWSPNILMRREQKHAAGMISALQQKATGTSVNVAVELTAGDPVKLISERVLVEPSIAVVGAPLERTSAEFHLTQNIILASSYPVLVARP